MNQNQKLQKAPYFALSFIIAPVLGSNTPTARNHLLSTTHRDYSNTGAPVVLLVIVLRLHPAFRIPHQTRSYICEENYLYYQVVPPGLGARNQYMN